MVVATNRLMAMSRESEREVTWVSHLAGALEPRSPAKWRVATIGARWTGWASQAATSAAVMWAWTMSASRRRSSALAAPATDAAGTWSTSRWSSDRIRAGSPPITAT